MSFLSYSVFTFTVLIIASGTVNTNGSPLTSAKILTHGNIGCTFSGAVCDGEKEFCYNDNAFGRCVPLYGMPDESNFFRYSLNKDDSHDLENIIERLSAQGYRWNHAFTQCTLQHLLSAIRYGWVENRRDKSDCVEVQDQDLKGAMKAFSDEVDPWDLAFIKYTPNAGEFADELYLPAQLKQVAGALGPMQVVANNARKESQNKLLAKSEAEETERQLEEKLIEDEIENYILQNNEQEPLSWRRKNPIALGGNSKLERNDVEDDENMWNEIPFEDQKQQQIEFIRPKIFSPIYNTPELFRQGVESRDELEFLNEVVPKILSDKPHQPPKLEFFIDDDKSDSAKYPSRPQPNQVEEMVENEQLRQALLRGVIEAEIEKNRQIKQHHRFSVPRKSVVEDPMMYMKDVPDNDKLIFLGNNAVNLKRPFFDPNNNNDYENNEQNDDGGLADFESVLSGIVADNSRNSPFERHERLDVKKPGPWYRTVNNFAFDDEDEKGVDENKENGWDFPINPEFHGIGPTGPIQKPGNQHHQQQQQPAVAALNIVGGGIGPNLADLKPNKNREKDVEELLKLIDKKTSSSATPPKVEEQAKPFGHEQLDIIDTSFVNVVVSNRIGWNTAREMINLLADLLDVKHSIFREVRVKDNVVTFKVGPNEKKLDAAEVARKIESFSSVILKESDVKIIKAEVGIRANLLKRQVVVAAKIYERLSDAAAVVNCPGPNCTNLDQNAIITLLKCRKKYDMRNNIIDRDEISITKRSDSPAALPLFDEGITRNNNLYVATFALCGVVAAVVVAAFTIYFVRKNAKSKEKFAKLGQDDPSMEACKDYQDLCRARMASKNNEKPESSTHSVKKVTSKISHDSEGGTSSSRSSTSSWTDEPALTNMDISTGHMVLSYMEDHLTNKSRLDQEWTALCGYEADPRSTTIAEKPDNAKKNRYSNSVPYDHSRVVLNELANISGIDYINASTITDHDPRNPAYIATQGPLQNTSADFWQMVWEQGSVVIVTLTRLKDNGTTLCHRYWPEEGSELHHIYEVHLVSEHIWCEEYLVRSFYLKNLKTGETRTVTQFHFLAWPENGIPSSTKAILEFRRKVNKSYRGRSCPIIVHCSDGAGRTGTYCLIDMVLNRMSKGAKEIDIAASLEHIRDQRAGMVRTKQQFEFVLMAVAEEVHAILKALPQ